jgi:hypothetical protein
MRLNAPAAHDADAAAPPRDSGTAPLDSLRPLLAPVEQLVAKHPAICLASAFALGAALAWWIKRK